MNHTDKACKLLTEVLQRYTVKEVAKKLDLADGTVKRWIQLKNVPDLYYFDLMKLVSKDIDYTEYTSKQKDQFFTPVATAQYCFDVFCEVMRRLNEDLDVFHYIEPSAGDGSFLKVLPQDKVIGLDIEPRMDGILKQDYLTWFPSHQRKYVVFGNPPFGLRGNLALRFINHSHNFADFVCFILPQLFESDGKGVPRKRVRGYNLIHTEKLKTNFYDPDNNDMRIHVVFQIWSKTHSDEKHAMENTENDKLKVYSLSDGGTPSSSRNVNMKDKCDVYLPSTCFGANNMKCYTSFEDLPGKKGYGVVFHKDKENMIKKTNNINWVEVSFPSTNSALNLRTSTITKVLLDQGV